MESNLYELPLTSVPQLATSTTSATARQPSVETVAERVTTAIAKVPSWFSVGAALRVAELKRAAHLLVLDRGALVGSISARVLASVPATDPLGRWMNRAGVFVSPETSTEEAWRLMACLGLECIPVVQGVLLLGVVARDALVEDDEQALAVG